MSFTFYPVYEPFDFSQPISYGTFVAPNTSLFLVAITLIEFQLFLSLQLGNLKCKLACLAMMKTWSE